MSETNLRNHNSIVPFPQFFAVVGYALVSLLVIVSLFELGGALAFHLFVMLTNPARQAVYHPCRGTGDGSCPASTHYDERWINLNSASPAYDGFKWAEDYWHEDREFRTKSNVVYVPFRLWEGSERHGRYVNMDKTAMGILRRTSNPLKPDCQNRKKLNVWVFGGSTTWGWGVPDFATLPSYLAQQLNQRSGQCYEVFNLGNIAYNSNQEVLYLMQELKEGSRPDVAVFYDGVNDMMVGANSPAGPGGHDDYEGIKEALESHSVLRPLLDGSFAFRLVRGLSQRFRNSRADSGSTNVEDVAQGTLQNYEGNIRQVRDMASGYGFEIYCFWQPQLLYGNKPLVPFERAVRENPDVITVYPNHKFSTWTLKAQAFVYEQARRDAAAGKGFEFLGDIFDVVRDPLYIDWEHVGPQGNEIVANSIAAKILAGKSQRQN